MGIWSALRSIGSKAVGFIRGLNGKKAAEGLTMAISANPKYGALAPIASPFLGMLGDKINTWLEEKAVAWSREDGGGIQKPNSYRNSVALQIKKRNKDSDEMISNSRMKDEDVD